MIITFISFIFLGFWTGVLALFNSRDSWTVHKQAKKLEDKPKSIQPIFKRNEPRPTVNIKLGQSKLGTALKDLWREILHG